MTKWESDLRVEVVGDEILVTLPQSNYAVRYYKPKNSPQLLAKRIYHQARQKLMAIKI
jgi:hypothetical protein